MISQPGYCVVKPFEVMNEVTNSKRALRKIRMNQATDNPENNLPHDTTDWSQAILWQVQPQKPFWSCLQQSRKQQAPNSSSGAPQANWSPASPESYNEIQPDNNLNPAELDLDELCNNATNQTNTHQR